jgi:ribonuclease HI
MDLNFEYLKIYFDGGSRGNPGPSAVGAVVYDKNDNRVDELSKFIGENTNNIAEYLALDMVLEQVKKFKVKYNIRRIILYTDSKLLYSQVKRIWKINDADIFNVYKRIIHKLKDYELVDLRLVPREDNTEADQLVNRALDLKLKGINGPGSLLGENAVNFGKVED